MPWTEVSTAKALSGTLISMTAITIKANFLISFPLLQPKCAASGLEKEI
jgi:hypothetical protein